MTKSIILTGIRANNSLTLGNYFGAMLPIVDMAKKRSKDYQVNMFIPDLHSFTTPIDHDSLYEQILHTARVFVAAGLPLDNDNIHIYRQSFVSAHSELTWILDCFTGYGEMSRMTQFKDKSAKAQEITVGLFNYPVLMAADILLYDATYIPVGDDQTQHLEYARNIAEKMNKKFDKSLFTVPLEAKKQHEFFGNEQGLRIMDLVDPTKKMSKSDESDRGVIFLTDSPDTAAKKIMGATTDDKAFIAFDPLEQPGISNLLQMSALLSDEQLETVIERYAGQEKYGDFKKVVSVQIQEFLTAFQASLSQVDISTVRSKLKSSELAMNIQANAKLLDVQRAVGLRKRS